MERKSGITKESAALSPVVPAAVPHPASSKTPEKPSQIRLTSSSSSSTLSSLCSTTSNTSSASLSSVTSTTPSGDNASALSSSRSSISSYTSSCSTTTTSGTNTHAGSPAPPISEATLSAERRRQARERLRSAMAAVSPGRRSEVKLPTSSAPDTPQKVSTPSSAEKPKIIQQDLPPEEEDAQQKSSQLGRLTLIAAASGWDIKLRELVMKEAKQGGDPSSSSGASASTTSLISPRRSLDRTRTTSGALLPQTGASAPDLTNPSAEVTAPTGLPGLADDGRRLSLRRRSTQHNHPHLSRFSASAPNVLRTRSVTLSAPPTPQAPQNETDGFGQSSDTLVDDEHGSKDRETSDSQSSLKDKLDQDRHLRSRRRASEYSTIVGAYDERLREIVMEAAGGLETRLRSRSSLVDDGISPAAEQSPTLRRPQSYSNPRRRRTLSVSTVNPMARSDADDHDSFTPSMRIRTAPSTPIRKTQTTRRQTMQGPQTFSPHQHRVAMTESPTAASPPQLTPHLKSTDDHNARKRWGSLLSKTNQDSWEMVETPSAMDIAEATPAGFVQTLHSIPASPISPIGDRSLPLPLPSAVSTTPEAGSLNSPPPSSEKSKFAGSTTPKSHSLSSHSRPSTPPVPSPLFNPAADTLISKTDAPVGLTAALSPPVAISPAEHEPQDGGSLLAAAAAAAAGLATSATSNRDRDSAVDIHPSKLTAMMTVTESATSSRSASPGAKVDILENFTNFL
ncbi:hypothetical protein DFJ77DRAFT_477052 [Powellomyces hirtus]|nr:hypothetical protein DFJ77DRAFT_477052 [Powellomyces hirtus]